MEDWKSRSFEKEIFTYVLKMYIFKIVKNDSFSRLKEFEQREKETKEFSQIEKNKTICNYLQIYRDNHF